jgi:alpha-tubulin suppressor-like RCC1 family protein
VQVTGIQHVVTLGIPFVLRADGTLWAWGWNDVGQLGDGTTETAVSPVRSVPLDGLVSFAGGGRHGIAMRADGTVWTWGTNNHGQLGDPTMASHLTPFQVVLP